MNRKEREEYARSLLPPLTKRRIADVKKFVAAMRAESTNMAGAKSMLYNKSKTFSLGSSCVVHTKSVRYDDARRFLIGYKADNVFYGRELSSVLIELEQAAGKTAAQVYGDANVSRALYSGLVCGNNTHPTKDTVLALAVGLKLDENILEQFVEFCGYVFPYDDTDLIVLYFVKNDMYSDQNPKERGYVRGLDMMRLNELLESCGGRVLGSVREEK